MNKVAVAVGRFARRTFEISVGMASYGAGLALGLGGFCAAVGWGFELGKRSAELKEEEKNEQQEDE